ncbi:MAG: 50S ribosomal protein L29 [Candidatus Yanofskybacteria bacterium RIFCSPLOWO2_02_FULL_45_10]|uniref:Large ribosomal subunit protein uL29 n=2 Tax=Candidatus Yanofskyibacteriota TaxID=1752733 RepID=A0A1F8G2M0_9BACT|nr:MAG: 50S ribosomal protein L29 [Candidatus Yanofskybacteria bacterium RIFCSPHIGHO2_12_FULL_45_19b]OGN32659.1 MAG: 50S ribosomal protein L29 [Candidatus Yanofskybacteria bacterium RIFCSPLOWO2_02_FULL_45_10]HXK35732.1 50S ribosomal protein L29 [Candidatus Paceibacterota bacterium]
MVNRPELNNKSSLELNQQLKELRAKLAQMHFSVKQNKLKDSSQLGKTRREIARVLTALISKKQQ